MSGDGGAIRQVWVDRSETEIEAREWFTAAELADLALPGLPADKRSLNRLARDERWLTQHDSSGEPLSRPRNGRGGGTEFHVSLLPGASRLDLAKRGLAPAPELRDARDDSAFAGSWRWWECQSEKTRAEAHRRVTIVAEIEALKDAGLTGTAAIAEASRRHTVSTATLWNWLKLVDGVARSDRLPALAPRRRGGGSEVGIDPQLWSIFKSDYLRPSAPTMTACYDRTAAIAAEKGLSLPSEKTMRRRLEQEVDPRVLMLRRKGEEALRRSLPAQRRTVEHMHALELVNIDGHKFDVFVLSPETGKPVRPMMTAIQDVYSSRVLAWRLAESENMTAIRLTFADLFENYGIPKGCLFDNGRGFAGKWITGGAKSRFRFKIKDEEPTGLITALGIHIHWALPYRGQSKPIERAFRDMCERIAKHPATEGAYVGNTPLAKPENYASRALGWDEFVALVETGIAAHNARQGRTGRHYRGRSFDEVFAESYAAAPIGKATPEQLRMALLAAEQVMVNRQTGEIQLFGNRYWSEGCGRLHGQRVTVRFDPDNLMRDIYLYDREGRYLTSAQLNSDVRFLDIAEAKTSAKKLADYRRKWRDAVDAEQLMSADEVARMQAGTMVPELPEPAVIRPVRHRGNTAAALKPDALRHADAPAPKQHESRVFTALGRLKAVE